MKKYYLFLFLSLSYPLLSFSQEILTVSTIERAPFSFHDKDDNFVGFSVELWEVIAKEAKLDYVWKEQRTFSKMIEDVAFNKADVAVANVSVTSAREKYVSFSHSILESGMGIAVKKGASVSYLAVILDSGILEVLSAAFFLLVLVAHIVWWLEHGKVEDKNVHFRKDYLGGIWDAFWWGFVILFMGGYEDKLPSKRLNRAITIMWIMASLMFIVMMNAKLTAAMTVSEFKSGISSYDDLYGKKVGVVGGSLHQHFLDSHGIKSQSYASLPAVYRALKREKIDALVSDLPVLDYYASKEGRDWMIITGSRFYLENYALMLTNDSPYLEAVNRALLRTRENGTYDKLYDKYFSNK